MRVNRACSSGRLPPRTAYTKGFSNLLPLPRISEVKRFVAEAAVFASMGGLVGR
jgi:hypothetical protein